MDLRAVIDEIAGQADDFLTGVSSRKEARAGVEELMTADYPQLGAADSKKVGDGVMAILEREGFFESDRVGSDWDGNSAESSNNE